MIDIFPMFPVIIKANEEERINRKIGISTYSRKRHTKRIKQRYGNALNQKKKNL